MATTTPTFMDALTFKVRRWSGLAQCCGATNQPCDSIRPPMTLTGCDHCGHAEGCHYFPR